MDRRNVSWIAAIAFVAGCVTASTHWVPPAWASNEPPVRWDYTCFENDSAFAPMNGLPSGIAESTEKKLKEAGAQGWELVTSNVRGTQSFYCLKRRIP